MRFLKKGRNQVCWKFVLYVSCRLILVETHWHIFISLCSCEVWYRPTWHCSRTNSWRRIFWRSLWWSLQKSCKCISTVQCILAGYIMRTVCCPHKCSFCACTGTLCLFVFGLNRMERGLMWQWKPVKTVHLMWWRNSWVKQVKIQSAGNFCFLHCNLNSNLWYVNLTFIYKNKIKDHLLFLLSHKAKVCCGSTLWAKGHKRTVNQTNL